MAQKNRLRVNREKESPIINVSSSKMEQEVVLALSQTVEYIRNKFKINLLHKSNLYLKDVVTALKKLYNDVDFTCLFNSTSMRPDGGILYLVSKDGMECFPVLITEVKNQGTNDLRQKEGKPKQSKGNAIERLGKNVIGFRTALLHEAIFPFVCFGDGCDFAPDSSILDRVVTIAMFGNLNKTRVHNEGLNGIFNRGSFYFREEKWTINEMQKIMTEIAEKSIYYYFSKYGEEYFK